ncbi:GNAT family N-acetyltransferase [Rufibacter ruber]|uniref:GNAT family N-acetyltransferase n=1 Tax=Rufibacter ruber TaxID=1783499 RepID=UPI00082BDD8F|nr:GNAT family N-acetyltransferase [Rufibacter ruber]
MRYREALLSDIPGIQRVRHAVKENILSDPALVTDHDCAEYLTKRGKGWVCLVNGTVVGFSIADLQGHNIWALFVDPDFEKKGVGRKLHALMLDWYFSQTRQTVWLSTDPASRARGFYLAAGWKEAGRYGKGEVKLEMEYSTWQQKQAPGRETPVSGLFSRKQP